MNCLRLLLLVCLPCLLTAQSERYDDFRMTITLDDQGDAAVTERITVTSDRKLIKRGITRVLRKKPVGIDEVSKTSMDYEVLSATRDGEPEGFHTRRRSGYETVYLGRKKVRLPAGQYTYELRYQAPDRIYQLADRQELRWSVFSSDVKLPATRAAVTLRLPDDVTPTATACWVGRQGSDDGTRCEVVRSGNELTYTVAGGFGVGEGLQITAAFPQGTFPEVNDYRAARIAANPPPTPLQRRMTLYLSLAGLLASLVYGFTAWRKYGVDPPTPEVGAQYHPPASYSPASLAYLYTGYATQDQLTASLTDLTIRGYLDIEEEERAGFLSKRDVFILHPKKDGIAGKELPPEQSVLYDRLHALGKVELDGEYDKGLARATNYHNESLLRQHKDTLQQGNNGWKALPYALILLVTVVPAAFWLKQSDTAGAILFGLAVLALGLGSLFFLWLIQQPSPERVELKARTNALREYLKLNERKRKALPGAPEMTPAYFQQMLPYAIALGVDNDWADDLGDYLTASTTDAPRRAHPALWMTTGFGDKIGSSFAAVSGTSGSSSGGVGGGGGVSGGGGGSGGW